MKLNKQEQEIWDELYQNGYNQIIHCLEINDELFIWHDKGCISISLKHLNQSNSYIK